jgi:hypothetical protein
MVLVTRYSTTDRRLSRLAWRRGGRQSSFGMRRKTLKTADFFVKARHSHFPLQAGPKFSEIKRSEHFSTQRKRFSFVVLIAAVRHFASDDGKFDSRSP